MLLLKAAREGSSGSISIRRAKALAGSQCFDSRPRPGGLQSLAAVIPIETRTVDPYLIRPNKASIAQRGAEGPGALQEPVWKILILQRSQTFLRGFHNLKRFGRVGPDLRAGRRESSHHVSRPPRGPEAFQVVIRASIVVLDLEGCSPISANLFCKISALAIRVSGLVRLALRPFDSSFQLGV